MKVSLLAQFGYHEWSPEGRDKIYDREQYLRSLTSENQDWLRGHLKSEFTKAMTSIDGILSQPEDRQDALLLGVLDDYLEIIHLDLRLLS